MGGSRFQVALPMIRLNMPAESKLSEARGGIRPVAARTS